MAGMGNPTRVMIVGGGVAAIEAMIALRHLAEDRVDLELVTPESHWHYRPLAVAEPFGLGKASRYDLGSIARDHGVAMHLAGVQAVETDEHRVVTWDGRRLDYEVLLLAVGAQPVPSVPGSVTIRGPGYTSRFRTVLRELDEVAVQRVVFAVPSGASWTLPLYELALMTARRVAERNRRGIALSIVTPEAEPLALFGAAASRSLRSLLDDRHIALHTSRSPVEVQDGRLRLVPRGSIEADRVVSLPGLKGPFVQGVPHDGDGFIPTDLHGLVSGLPDVYAAGDATTCPVKQGGLAAQQADAAAEAIAARAGAPVEPSVFRPVLRGLLLTGDVPRYLRADVAGGLGERSEASEHALWWPPSKIAGRYLAPYLAARHGEFEAQPTGVPVEVDLETQPVRRRAIIGRNDDGNVAALTIAHGPRRR